MMVRPLGRWVLVLAEILCASSAAKAQREQKPPTLAEIRIIRSAVCSPDRNALLVNAVPTDLALWDTKTGQLRIRLEEKGGTPQWDCIAISPDGKKAAAIALYFAGAPGAKAKMGRDLAIWDLATGKIVEEQTLPEWKKGKTPPFLEFSKDGAFLYSIWDNRILKIKVGGRNRTLAHKLEGWDLCAFDPKAKLLILARHNVGKLGTELRFLPVAKDAKSHSVALTSNVLSLAFSPDGKTLAISYDGRWDKRKPQIELWDVATREIRTTLAADTRKEFQGYYQMVFSPDGKSLAGVPFFTTGT